MVLEDIFGELLEIFGEIFDDFWILFDALIRAVRVVWTIRAVRAIRAIRVVNAVRVVREVRTNRANRVVRVVRAVRESKYKERGEQYIPHSCLDCHRRNIKGLRCFEAFFASCWKKEEYVSTRPVGFAPGKNVAYSLSNLILSTDLQFSNNYFNFWPGGQQGLVEYQFAVKLYSL